MYKKVQAVNEILEKQGAAIVQKFAKLKSTGRDIYGYQPQAVFSAMCEVFGPDGWKHQIVDIQVTEKQVIARISATLGGRTSEQYGEHRIMAGDLGSAYKSAVTDGIQKALSLFGVGAKAYRGELETVFNGKISETVNSENFEVLRNAAMAQAKIGIEEGRTWWRQNLAHIQAFTGSQREELVKILGGK